MPNVRGNDERGAPFNVADDWTGVVTAKASRTPASGNYLRIENIGVSLTAACNITFFWDSDTLANRVGKYTGDGSGWSGNPKFPVDGPRDGVLKYSTSAAGGSFNIVGKERP